MDETAALKARPLLSLPTQSYRGQFGSRSAVAYNTRFLSTSFDIIFVCQGGGPHSDCRQNNKHEKLVSMDLNFISKNPGSRIEFAC